MTAPRVSIVLPSRNGSRHLDEAIGSVVSQTSKDWELVLVDDGSTDDTGARMDAWAARDRRVRAVHLSPNRGLPAALNEGFRHARGELFSWTSDDNVYLPGAIERMSQGLASNPDADLVYADYVSFDEAGHQRRTCVFSKRMLALRATVGCCFLYRREVHEQLGGYDEDLFLAEDYDFWLRASAAGFRFEAIPEVLYRYRVHGSSLTARHGVAAHLAALRALDRFLPTLDRPQRAHALLQRAQTLFRRGQPREARALTRRAILASPSVSLRPEHRRALASSLLGHRVVRRTRAALGRSGARAIRLFLPNYLGGVTTYCMNLAAARPPDGPPLEWYWLAHDGDGRAQAPPDLLAPVERVERIRHGWPGENLFAVLRRMRGAVGSRPGVIVANEFFGLAYAARFGRGDPLVQILHQDAPLYYELAERFEPFVDVFVTVSAKIRDELVRRLPERAADIRYLRSGVATSGPKRSPRSGPLRLVFSGRFEPVKGVLDLPAIDRLARSGGADVTWTILGAGPLEAALRSGFAPEANVHFTGALPYAEARARLAHHDVLVLPSHAEGLSLSLLEAMAAGVVPVVSDLASGTREVVEPGSTGFLARPGQPEEFARAIVQLAAHRELLEQVSAAAANRIARRHSLEAFGAAFFELLDDVGRRPIPYRPRYRRGISRLDRPWLPNLVVRAVRKLTR